jgi:hypothetical protein
MTWTPEAVWDREVEAMRTLCRLPLERARSLRSNWPALRRGFADAVAAEETRDPRNFPVDWSKPGPPEPRAIDRMIEVWAWHARYLADEAEQVRILQGMALAAARGRPELSGVGFLKRRRWAAYRLKRRALQRLAGGLNGGEAVPPPRGLPACAFASQLRPGLRRK